MKKIRNAIIKLCGGYTAKEYKHLEHMHQRLLDSQFKDSTPRIVNEYIWRTLAALDNFAKSLYTSDSWEYRMYHVIHNNTMRVMTYLVRGRESSAVYRLDTTLDNENYLIQALDERIEEYPIEGDLRESV